VALRQGKATLHSTKKVYVCSENALESMPQSTGLGRSSPPHPAICHLDAPGRFRSARHAISSSGKPRLNRHDRQYFSGFIGSAAALRGNSLSKPGSIGHQTRCLDSNLGYQDRDPFSTVARHIKERKRTGRLDLSHSLHLSANIEVISMGNRNRPASERGPVRNPVCRRKPDLGCT